MDSFLPILCKVCTMKQWKSIKPTRRTWIGLYGHQWGWCYHHQLLSSSWPITLTSDLRPLSAGTIYPSMSGYNGRFSTGSLWSLYNERERRSGGLSSQQKGYGLVYIDINECGITTFSCSHQAGQ